MQTLKKKKKLGQQWRLQEVPVPSQKLSLVFTYKNHTLKLQHFGLRMDYNVVSCEL